MARKRYNRVIQYGMIGAGGIALAVAGPMMVSRGKVSPTVGFLMTIAGIASIVSSVVGIRAR